ncbi:SapC family protein [Alteromonas pelagimontana]|uniref:SapC family protein n=1 Tax=Alteromonas pelagimontana TaxID=1858656 RepID=A0A6M4ME69_9ALTE|nr:SapC family protein [Alteromonas pelagimontana]QJR81317.1 SapC family protein [Alteromonas pelagimontana]
MTQHVLLNNAQHQHIKVINQFHAQYGDNVAGAMVFPTEFVELQKEYPIVFRRDAETEKYQAMALLGIQQGENLYLDESLDSGWAAHYIPATLARGPFLIGFQTQQENGGTQKVPVIHIDMDHPKVNEQKGRALFLEHGGNSPYLEHVSTILKNMHQGIAANDAMFAAFNEYELIEPVNIEIELDNGEKSRLVGNYTINDSKLQSLNAEQLAKLHHAGFLQLAFAVVASMSNIRKLIEMKNRRDRG